MLQNLRLPTSGVGAPSRGFSLFRASPDAPKRCHRWTLNGDFAKLADNGVARYARETVAALDELVGEGHPLTCDLSLELVAPTPWRLENIPVRVVEEFRTPRLPQVWVQLQLPRHVHGGLVSFCNLAPVSVSRHIVCIHDLHTFLMPESYGLGFRLAHRAILPVLGRRAARITTVSALSRDNIASHAIAPREKVHVTYNGADHARRWQAGNSTLKRPSGREYVFCLGRNQAYKNTELVWRLAHALDEMNLDVYIAGDMSANPAAALPVPSNLHLLGRVSDADLARLYDDALCFLFPSRIEGFGIPAVEAMIRDCPVIASTAPCLPEICGEAALYAGPDDVDGWVRAIRSIKELPGCAAEQRKKGRERAELFSWRRVAETYLELMAEIDDEAQV